MNQQAICKGIKLVSRKEEKFYRLKYKNDIVSKRHEGKIFPGLI